jgi:hypothetical protein
MNAPSSRPNRRLFVLALVGCFVLAFGAAYVFEVMLGWLLQVWLRMGYTEMLLMFVYIWRTIAALAVAALLCIWLSRR